MTETEASRETECPHILPRRANGAGKTTCTTNCHAGLTPPGSVIAATMIMTTAQSPDAPETMTTTAATNLAVIVDDMKTITALAAMTGAGETTTTIAAISLAATAETSAPMTGATATMIVIAAAMIRTATATATETGHDAVVETGIETGIEIGTGVATTRRVAST